MVYTFVCLLAQAVKGNHLYAMGDHGGVLVAIKPYSSGGEVDSLIYSTDEGDTWQTYKFFQEVCIYEKERKQLG